MPISYYHTTKKHQTLDVMVRGLASLSTLILAAVGSAAPLAPSVDTETNPGVRTVHDKTRAAVPDVFFYNWGGAAKREEAEPKEAVPDIVFVGWKREEHREEQN
ncbi:hypothetical protein F4820DRAFT_449409 [Hypoxylon rubiginosum]|uniref:Uncharacterized protein n=1 Tax=Hypoxylon rubiginosum TaxID=110542 RepID=A0ACB9YX95_9PEZI|nr:hypothetical protein F4820DRAFT_449409 [Hypoxylon rubiginosum]